MKKTFNLVHPKIKAPRIVDSIKHEIKKYQKKETSQSLPKDMKYWSFDCKVGQTEESASVVLVADISRAIDDLLENKAKSIYVEMEAKAVATLDGKV